jgi:hypothetical protein
VHNRHADLDGEEWVIWNGANGLLTTVTIGRVEDGADGRSAWLEEPFDMVGPFDLDELEALGRIAFAAALVMSRERWQQDQLELRRESAKIRRAEAERINRKYGQYTGGHGGTRENRQQKPFDENKHRKTLKLPIDGKLEPRQVNAAFRRLAQKVHPDAGGSHEQFVQITEARNALLETLS